jgi:hypothetical protein
MALIDEIRGKISAEQFEFSSMLLTKALSVASAYRKAEKSSAMLK